MSFYTRRSRTELEALPPTAILTYAEVESLYGFSRQRIYYAVQRGHIKAIRTRHQSNMVGVVKESLEKYAKNPPKCGAKPKAQRNGTTAR